MQPALLFLYRVCSTDLNMALNLRSQSSMGHIGKPALAGVPLVTLSMLMRLHLLTCFETLTVYWIQSLVLAKTLCRWQLQTSAVIQVFCIPL